MGTTILAAIMVLVSLWGFSSRAVIERFGFSAYMARKAQQYERFLTHAFVHGDVNHLFLNVLVFIFFAPDVELILGELLGRSVGTAAMILFFLSAVVIASIPDYFKERHNPNYISVGASGGVSAIVFSTIVFSPLSSICLYGALCMPGFIWGIAYVAYSYFQDKSENETRINHSAHLWGAVYGAVFMVIVLLLTGQSPVF